MIDSPPGNTVPVIADTTAPVYTPCTRQLMTTRIGVCKICVNRTDEEIPKCSLNQLDINLMISVNEQTCPEGYW
jgi:hypothetical protein